MDINVIKMLKSKLDEGSFTLEQIKMVCPDYETQTEILELLDNPFVQEYNKLLAEIRELELIPDVSEYIKLTKPVVKSTGHSGSKTPMPCLVCGNESHSTGWNTAKVDNVDYWIGDLKEKCPDFVETRFKIQRGLTIEKMKELKFPFSGGQLGGRYKKDTEDGFRKETK